MKRIVVLGSTGPVGRQALDVVRTFRDQFRLVGLAAGSNHALLARQVEEFEPDRVYFSEGAVPDPPPVLTRRRSLSMEEMVALPEVDLVVSATVSALAGLPGTLAALQAGKRVVLANNEVMVMAGGLLMQAARNHDATIIPADGSLSAIWQCLRGEPSEVKRVVFTVTEGPFIPQDHPLPSPLPSRERGLAEVAGVVRHEAVTYPIRRVGKKARVDTITMINVGMQTIATHHLFGIPYDRMEVVSHPEGVVRAMVEFCDGSLKSVLNQPASHLPLQYALSYPERWSHHEAPPVDLVKLGELTFHPIDPKRYPCLEIALRAGRTGGTAPVVMNAANEVAVRAFLNQNIGLNEVPELIDSVVSNHQAVADPALQDLYQADAWARAEARVRSAGFSPQGRAG